MKTFILKWRPLISSYKMEQFEEEMHYIEYGEFNWSVHEWEKARSKDFVYICSDNTLVYEEIGHFNCRYVCKSSCR